MSVLKTLTSIGRALLRRDGSTRERSVKVCHRIEGSVENIDIAQRCITVRIARESSARRLIQVPETARISQQGQQLRLEHVNLYDHVWVVFSKNPANQSLEAVDIELIG